MTRAFRFHADISTSPKDYDDEYRTLTLNEDGTFTDYYEHLWDLKEGWVTEGVSLIVYSGTYTLDVSQIMRLTYQAIISKVNNVVTGKETLEAEEPLNEQVIASGTLSKDGKSLTVMKFQAGGEAGGGEAEPQTLVMGGCHEIRGGKYS
jgi:hypothetical protein